MMSLTVINGDPHREELADLTALQAAVRVRTARAYAGYTQTELADRLGVKVLTVKRMEGSERSDRPTRPPSVDQLFAVADVCGVPRHFMVEGFTLNAAMTLTPGELEQLLAEVLQTIGATLADRLAERIDETVRSRMSVEQVDALLRDSFVSLRRPA